MEPLARKPACRLSDRPQSWHMECPECPAPFLDLIVRSVTFYAHVPELTSPPP